MKRQKRVTPNDDINELTWRWFQDASARRAEISGPMIQEQARVFAESLEITTFKASNGWLDSFFKRHNIVFKTMSGEHGDVDNSVVDNWVQIVLVVNGQKNGLLLLCVPA